MGKNILKKCNFYIKYFDKIKCYADRPYLVFSELKPETHTYIYFFFWPKGVAQSNLEKAEEFNGQFTDVFNKNEHTQVPLLDRSAPFMNDIVISKDGVIKLLKGFSCGSLLLRVLAVRIYTLVQLLC